MNGFDPKRFTILMVDDNPKNLQLLGTTLRNEGFQVEFATNGRIALNWVSKKNFDLILLDIMMPELSGYEVCEQIRKIKEYDDVPIIFLTAKTEKESVVYGFKVGAQDYITKPFDTAELLARVRTHLELRYNKLELKNINHNLEKLVEERTHELNILNQKLQKANEELRTLDKAKSEFLHIIAHEIRTPLNGIKGSIDIMKELNEHNSFGALFNILEESVTRLERFSLFALKITQLQTGKYELDLQPIAIHSLVQQILQKFKEQIQKKLLKITLKIPKELFVTADWELINTCFSAVIDNAIKFTHPSGSVFIEAEEDENHILVKITDEGPGFSDKAMQNLFKLFSPGERHINENEGIDLAMAKLIMDAHRGEIQINNYAKGAVVSLIFPKNEVNLNEYANLQQNTQK
ncbi:MAG TPA: hybrid sensor histidine kinase/response regulator [Bacteroidales bacterium]|nr:hybrid sensor histidine kinase/response regulator [Bacteroidales bacterium]HPO64345.1 hybrid sensor histidine kinase/response regulator [Bacteroidales bacterium]